MDSPDMSFSRIISTVTRCPRLRVCRASLRVLIQSLRCPFEPPACYRLRFRIGVISKSAGIRSSLLNVRT